MIRTSPLQPAGPTYLVVVEHLPCSRHIADVSHHIPPLALTMGGLDLPDTIHIFEDLVRCCITLSTEGIALSTEGITQDTT
jgi:hypothetical protein